MDGKKAQGVDGVSRAEYDENPQNNLEKLVTRMKCGTYQPQPSRRIYIEKPGSTKKRPLGISCYEDKLVEAAIAEILNAVYEPKFLDISYGFRPDRSCHHAIKEVVKQIQGLTNYVVEADIRSYFNTIDHEWMMKFLEHDTEDKKFPDIIQKLLKAGSIENDEWKEATQGSAQGNGASPVLSNVYLHYVLDTWFEILVKKNCRGEAHLARYADDYVCCFRYKDDAERFYHELPRRFEKFGLELAEEKTGIIQFGRFAEGNRRRAGKRKAETFDFLGYTIYGSHRKTDGKYQVKVKTSRKKMNAKLAQFRAWMKRYPNS